MARAAAGTVFAGAGYIMEESSEPDNAEVCSLFLCDMKRHGKHAFRVLPVMASLCCVHFPAGCKEYSFFSVYGIQNLLLNAMTTYGLAAESSRSSNRYRTSSFFSPA